MNTKIALSLLCMLVLSIHSTFGEAARKQARRAPHHHSAPSGADKGTRPYGVGLNEEQSLRALESEISRKLGSSIHESDYPEEARREGWTGTTRVDVLVGSDGKIKEASVQQSSGFAVLDEQALRMIDRISLWWIPKRLRNREVMVTVPVGFYLREVPEPWFMSSKALAGLMADRMYLPSFYCRTADQIDAGLIASLALDLEAPVRPVENASLADWSAALALYDERLR
jgi:TonB family protein